MKYPLTFYVDSLPDDAAGVAQGPIIRILKSHKDDVGLYQHELMHVKQWFCTLGLHSFLYLLFDSYVLWSEVQAYRKQAEYYPDDRKPLFASYISKYYDLNLTTEKALELLNE